MSEPTPSPARRLRVHAPRVVLVGTLGWVVALVVTLLVPSLHSADRDWWPMTCAVGIVVGALGYALARATTRTPRR